MKPQYLIYRTNQPIQSDEVLRELHTAPKALINQYPWLTNMLDYQPEANAAMLHDDGGIHVLLSAAEPSQLVTTVYTKDHDPVFQDSCLEFFVRPDPLKQDYYNLEWNANGCLLVGYGPDKWNRTQVDPSKYESFYRRAYIRRRGVNTFWSVYCYVPFHAVGASDYSLRQGWSGNFYKCGDHTPHPHYGCWSRVNSDNPDFHLPDQFGLFEFVDEYTQ
ncbi:carbohydrate-binding family 9-like protein [Paenibacillus sp. GCM10023252]|uniref:carbohydrate-binding family 9-like protein n=1 Tax=Paenibacillus sp. GCM10023252 TaxID=3252649 RepID=UPI00360D4CD9